MLPHDHPRRALAALLVAAAAGGSAAAPAVSHAATRAPAPAVKANGLLDGLGLPGPVPTLSTPELTTLLTQLTGAGADPAALQALVTQLTPTQITDLLGSPTALTGVLDGLRTTVAGLLAGTPTAAPVDSVLAQVEALLAGGLPTDPAQLAELQTILGGLPALLGTPGLDAGTVGTLQTTVETLLRSAGVDPSTGLLPGGAAPAPGSVASALLSVLGATQTSPTSTTPPATGGGGAGTPAGAPGTTAKNTRFRAKVLKVKLARNRRAVRVTLSCPATAPACVVGLRATAAGRRTKARFAGLRAGQRKVVRVKLSAATAKRLRAKGGKVKISASTVGSSLGASTRSVRAKRA